jgi:uncharacterized protein YndB with AHSA1/START domain
VALKILLIAVLIVGAILVYAAAKPSTFRIGRSIEIHAPPEKIFPLINDFHNWSQWAPQDREDPTTRRTYSGAASGVGAEAEWTSKGQAGSGRMSITESVPPSVVTIDAHWVKPFAARNVNEFRLEPVGDSTKVSWTMQGPNLYVMKLMSVFVNMDRMMGRHFESGLKNLKAAAE